MKQCRECGSEMLCSFEPYQYKECGISISVDSVEIRCCWECNSKSVVFSQMGKLYDEIAKSIFQQDRLSLEEINWLSRYHGEEIPNSELSAKLSLVRSPCHIKAKKTSNGWSVRLVNR